MIASLLGLIAALATAPLQAAGPATPLPAAGTWAVSQEHLTCTVTHAYDQGAAAQSIAFSYFKRGGISTVRILSRQGYSGPSWRSDVTVAIGQGPAIAATATASLQPDQKWLTQIWASQDAIIDPSLARSITIRFGTARPVTLAVPEAKAAITMLEACQSALSRKWGIDPAEADLVASGSGAIGNPADWITPDDYPAASLANKETGKTMILWRIGIDGLASDCRVVESSGHPLLDQAACDAILRRARYAPALDKNRKPVPSHASRNVVWSLPG